MRKRLVLLLALILLVGCNVSVDPIVEDSTKTKDIRTIPGNTPKSLYSIWEIEGITYYSFGGSVVCPATDRAIQKLAEPF